MLKAVTSTLEDGGPAFSLVLSRVHMTHKNCWTPLGHPCLPFCRCPLNIIWWCLSFPPSLPKQLTCPSCTFTMEHPSAWVLTSQAGSICSVLHHTFTWAWSHLPSEVSSSATTSMKSTWVICMLLVISRGALFFCLICLALELAVGHLTLNPVMRPSRAGTSASLPST